MVNVALEITAARPDPALLDLPWHLPLETWPQDYLAALPRGISRHVVRFVRLSNRVLAVKEIKTEIAFREYHLLRTLDRLDMPCVEPFAHRQRPGAGGRHRLDACLITRHLQFSLPYRALFSQTLRPDTAERLHRRPRGPAGAPAPGGLLVGRRVAVQHPVPARCRRVRGLPRRRRDRRAARAAQRRAARARPGHRPGQHRRRADGPRGGRPAARVDPTRSRPPSGSCRATSELWDELTGARALRRRRALARRRRIRRLNELGFDVDELAITTDIGGTSIQIQPKVVDAGHHSRRLLRLTGLDVEENQARRLLNDLDAFRAATGPAGRGRGDRRARLAGQGLRAGHPRGAAGADGQAGAGRGLPRGARAPLVHGGAGAARRPDPGRHRRLRRHRCCPASPTSRRCSASTPWSCPSSPCSPTRVAGGAEPQGRSAQQHTGVCRAAGPRGIPLVCVRVVLGSCSVRARERAQNRGADCAA